MTEYLIFFFNAPMASFGTYAGHERRGSDNVLHRSAILGLIGAALGIKRNDSEAQLSLRRYRVAVQSLTENVHLRDYHTAQTVHRKIRRPDSRRVAIEAAGQDIKTTITYRDYRTDVAFAVAVWEEGDAWPLSVLAEALVKPSYVLYAGRKSCPFSAPLAPIIVEAPDPRMAIRDVELPTWLDNASHHGPITCDPFQGGCPDWIETGPVEPIDRDHWHFSQSEVWHFNSMSAP